MKLSLKNIFIVLILLIKWCNKENKYKSFQCLFCCKIFHNPRQEGSYAWVHSWIPAWSASDSPRYNADLIPRMTTHNHQWTYKINKIMFTVWLSILLPASTLFLSSWIAFTSWITTATVASIFSGANHRINNTARRSTTILLATNLVRPNWYRYFL